MPLGIEELRRKLRYRVETEKGEFATRSLHLLERALKAGTTLRIGPHDHGVPNEAFLIIIDEAPGAFWTHPVRYELHEVATGKVRIIHEQYPLESPDVKAELVALHIPDLPWLNKEGDKDFPKAGPIDFSGIEKQLAKVSFGVPLAQASRRHALFFAGMDNMPHFHTDFVMMREVLIDDYGYDPANIVIAMGDGTGYPDLPVDHAGDQTGLEAALDAFAAGGSHALGVGDTLFLYTFNHGGADASGAYLCLPNWGSYYDFQLKAKLDNIQCGQLIAAMNQCHSGGFISDVTATTGPAQVAIMTACREDQSAYPSGGTGTHGYFSVALATALNWAFPASIFSTFPGYTAGAITAQDTNSDGLVSAEEAFDYIQSLMAANHSPTMNGIETPQWGVSSAGAGASLFWGLPDLVVSDGTPWWESPDIFLENPASAPDDATALPGNPANWGDDYHPDTVNRIVARVHNEGCAPARNARVEFRVMSFGTGGGTTLVGIAPVPLIEPGQHVYAYVDWNFPSTLIHRCVMVRADCAGDPAAAFGVDMTADDNQAQRNLDPLYAAPDHAARQVIKQDFVIRNPLKEKIEIVVIPQEGKFKSEQIRLALTDFETIRRGALMPGETKTITVQFEVAPRTRLGEKLHVPLEIRQGDAKGKIIGGVTFAVETAAGQLEGKLFLKERVAPREGMVRVENIKQPALVYSTQVTSRGTFSFPGIVPGPYRLHADCGVATGATSVFVSPNRVTSKAVLVERKVVVSIPAEELVATAA